MILNLAVSLNSDGTEIYGIIAINKEDVVYADFSYIDKNKAQEAIDDIDVLIADIELKSTIKIVKSELIIHRDLQSVG